MYASRPSRVEPLTRGGLVLALAFALALAPALGAGTIKVSPDDGDTPLADAVAQLQDGDRLLLEAGTYAERLILAGLSKVKVLAQGEVVLQSDIVGATISVTNCERIQLRGLTVLDSPSKGILVDGSQKVVVKDCTVVDHTTQGVQVDDSTDVLIKGCTVEGGSYGVYLIGDTTAKVLGNTISGPSDECILVVIPGLPGIRLERNVLTGATGAGIELAGPGNRADRNEISDCTFGIVTPFAGGDMSGSRVARNTITSTLVALRTYASGGVQFVGNSVVDAEASAMQVAGIAEGVEVLRNKVVGANAGIDDEGSGSLVARNKVAGTETYGVRARGEAGTFERNTVRDTPGDGFDVWTGGNTFTRNRATGNAGVDLDSNVAEGENTFEKNTFGTTDFPG